MAPDDFEWVCACCGRTRRGIPALVASHPETWIRSATGTVIEATDDTCVVEVAGDTVHLIHAMLDLPVRGTDIVLAFGVWVSLSAENYRRYAEALDSPDQSRLGTMFGWLASGVPTYPGSRNLPTTVRPLDDGRRPLVEVSVREGEAPHPLKIDQSVGISLYDLSEILGTCLPCDGSAE